MNKKEISAETASMIVRMQTDSANHQKMTSHRFFLGYVYDLFTHTPIYTHWKNLLAYFRRFRTVTFILRTLTLLLSIVETGALVILSTAVFLVILPILAALMLGILITARIESKRTNQNLLRTTQSKRSYVLFLPLQSAPFFSATVKEFAANGDVVFLVSPYWISPKGVSKGRFYCTARKEAEGIYLVRRYYFFSLRKHVLSQTNAAYVY